MIVQMRTAGMFDNINGLIIGELEDMKDQETQEETQEVVEDTNQS